MEEIIFKVQGSKIEPYEVTFIKTSTNNLSAYCTCKAGKNGQNCKHRFSIFEGKQQNIISANIEDVKIISSWLVGTDIEIYMHAMRDLENEKKRVENELSSIKKKLAKAMYHG